MPGCSMWRHTIQTLFTTAACWRTNKAEVMKPINLIGQSLALSPNQADWHSNLGIVLQSTGRLGDAIVEYERAIAIDPDHANAHSNLGVLLRAAGRPEEAEAAYRTAIRLRPDHVDAYTNLGILLNGLQPRQGGLGVLLQGDHVASQTP